jgi:hypothetical protein
MGSQPPCGGAAKGSNRPFRDLTLGKFTATYAKLFKTLVFAATRPKQRAIPVQTGVVPVFPSSAHSDEGFSMRAIARGFAEGLTLARVDKPLKEEAVGC